MNCSELKEGQVLVCEGCRSELQVVEECRDKSCSTDSCCTVTLHAVDNQCKLKNKLAIKWVN